jgi:hypothetical protein
LERPVHVVAERELITQTSEWKKKKEKASKLTWYGRDPSFKFNQAKHFLKILLELSYDQFVTLYVIGLLQPDFYNLPISSCQTCRPIPAAQVNTPVFPLTFFLRSGHLTQDKVIT